MNRSADTLTGEELADAVGLSPSTIRRYAREGMIPAIVSPGGHRKYDRAAAIAALEAIRDRLRREALADEKADQSIAREVGDFGMRHDEVPPTPRGPFIAVAARVTIREHARPLDAVMTTEEWNELVEVLDADY